MCGGHWPPRAHTLKFSSAQHGLVRHTLSFPHTIALHLQLSVGFVCLPSCDAACGFAWTTGANKGKNDTHVKLL
jgi:hypothetical protein